MSSNSTIGLVGSTQLVVIWSLSTRIVIRLLLDFVTVIKGLVLGGINIFFASRMRVALASVSSGSTFHDMLAFPIWQLLEVDSETCHKW